MAPFFSSPPPKSNPPSWWPSSIPFPEALNSHTTVAVGAAVIGGIGALTIVRVHRRYFRRYPTVDTLPADIFTKKRWIRGVVTSVGDADNFRLYHTPGPFWRWPLKLRRIPTQSRALVGQTLHIRLAGVDAPEAAHFGRSAQPGSAEALAWLKSMVDGRTVYCQLVSRDQYSRIVGVVTLPPRILPAWIATGRNVSQEMLKAGWATTYEQAGATYGERTREQFQLLEAEAKAAKRGMWKSGTGAETPAEYKKRHRMGGEEPVPAPVSKTTRSNGKVKVTPKPWWWPF